MFSSGDKAHTGLDNITFLTHATGRRGRGRGRRRCTAQRNALDSAYLFDVDGASQPAPAAGFIAEGRDPSATIDSALSARPAQNEGDNEITGIHVSDGDPSVDGLLGVKVPTLFSNGWRMFWTQQHGDNNTYEVSPAP